MNQAKISCAVLVLTVILLTNPSADEKSRDKLGIIDDFQGTVKLHINNGVKDQLIQQTGVELHDNDRLRSKRNSSANITLVDNSRIILTEHSQIQFKGISQISYESGKVLFDIQKQGGLKGFQITSKTAIIGVKGTQFLIDNSNKKLSIYMKEGTIVIKSVKGQFKRFKQQKLDEFETFRQKSLSEFDSHKEALNREFSEFVNSFRLTGGQAISIDQNDVRDVEIPEDIKKMFLMFES